MSGKVAVLRCKNEYATPDTNNMEISNEEDLETPVEQAGKWDSGELVMEMAGKILAITVDHGLYWVGFYEIENANTYSLLSGKGGCGFEYVNMTAVPRRFLVGAQQAISAAKEFYRTETIDLSKGWEPFIDGETEEDQSEV